MCCILCEEPVRSITFGLAALGIVAVVNGTRKIIAHARTPQRAEQADAGAIEAALGDAAP
jgi:hypothetical protein